VVSIMRENLPDLSHCFKRPLRLDAGQQKQHDKVLMQIFDGASAME
jgi:hypothetical protein